jgi:hypothetical protein
LRGILDVDAPGFQIGADRALALAALVDGDRGVVRDLQEPNDGLVLAIGTPDVRAEATQNEEVAWRPYSAASAG